jgi:hypothetical protein
MFILTAHLLVTLAKLVKPGGFRVMAAELLAVKHLSLLKTWSARTETKSGRNRMRHSADDGEKCLSLLAQSCAFRKRHQTLRFGFSLNLAAKSALVKLVTERASPW